MPLPNIQPPISNDISVVTLGNLLLELKRSLTAQTLTDIITNYTGFNPSSSYAADGVWIQIAGSVISHIGPSTVSSSQSCFTGLGVSGNATDAKVDFTTTFSKLDAKGHSLAWAANGTTSLTIHCDTWLSLTPSGGSLSLAHCGPKAHNAGSYDITTLQSVNVIGTTITLGTTKFFFDDRGHSVGTTAVLSSTNVMILPGNPSNDGVTYILTVRNGTLAWVASAACP